MVLGIYNYLKVLAIAYGVGKPALTFYVCCGPITLSLLPLVRRIIFKRTNSEVKHMQEKVCPRQNELHSRTASGRYGSLSYHVYCTTEHVEAGK